MRLPLNHDSKVVGIALQLRKSLVFYKFISYMVWYIVKIFISALIIFLVSEVSKRLPLMGSLIPSLPLISVLGMIWIFQETKDIQKIITHAEGTFWYVLPSLPMFLVMPWLMKKGFSFYFSLGCGIILTFLLYLIMTKILSKLGMNL